MDDVVMLMFVFLCMKCVESSCPITCKCTSVETSCRNASLHSVPDDLSEDTIKLVLTNNRFPALDSRHLRKLSHLKFIDLSYNHISTIENEVFCTSERLETLNLSNNEIELQNSDTFYCLKNLRRLDLKNNNISSVPPGLFRNNADLVVLDLSYNRIQFLESRTFQQNILLSLVIIEANPVSNISDSVCLSGSLNVLDIESCGYQSIISYQRYPTLENEQNITQVKDFLPTDLPPSDRYLLLNAIKPKLDALGYSELDYLYYNATMHTVNTYSGAPVFCYCNLLSVWYWCVDKVSNYSDVMYVFHKTKCVMVKEQRTDEVKPRYNGQVEAKRVSRVLVLITLVMILLPV